MPKYKPMVLDDITIGNHVAGHIVGINLKDIDYSDSMELEKYIEQVLRIKDESHDKIFIEGFDKKDKYARAIIEDQTSLIFPNGDEIINYNIPIIIRDVFKEMKRDISKQEVLLMVDKKEEAIKLIDSIINDFNFISLIGMDEKEADLVYEEILDKTGVSIIQPLDLEKTIDNYNVLINKLENPTLNWGKLGRKTVVFDLSLSKKIKESCKYLAIHDVKLNSKDLDIKDNIWIKELISSDLYAGLAPSRLEKYSRILVGDNSYYIKDYIEGGTKIKGGL